MNEFKRGFSYFLSGFALIFKPKIRFYTIIPLLINITLFTIVIFYAFSMLENFIAVFQAQWRWIEWLIWLIKVVFFIGISIVVFFCFSIFANIISAPFNALLARAVEERLTGKQIQLSNKQSLLNLITVSMRSEFRKLIYFSIRIPILLLLFFIPIINIIAPLIWFVFSSWMIAIEYCDYPMSNHDIVFEKQRKKMAKNRQLIYGFGVGAMLLTLIPILNFITIPVSVAGATNMCIGSIWREH